MFSVRNSVIYVVQQGKRLDTHRPLFCFGLQDFCNVLQRLSSTASSDGEEVEKKKLNKMVEYGLREEKSSRAMRAYLQRSQAYNEFMEKEEAEFLTGKRHLANMMGRDAETFTQADVDEAIEYLLPSGLFVPKTRPFLKPPKEVHPPQKEAEFDETGRPHHFLFYTGRPTFYGFLHKLVDKLKELDAFEDSMIRKQLKPDPALAIQLEGYQWLSQEKFEAKFLEEITPNEYRQLITTIERIAKHPYGYRAKDMVTECQVTATRALDAVVIPKPELQEDGRQFVTYEEAKRKSARATVTVRSPGTGLLSVNGFDLLYFEDVHVREQVLFPLHFTGMLNKVDVEAQVRGGGPSGQSGAIRYGMSMALRSFVEPTMVEKMRLAGLLTQDRRVPERKKPGQAGARRKFTWKKR